MRLPWKRKRNDIADLRNEGDQRLAEAKEIRERLDPKLSYQEQRHRTNAVFEEAAWVLSRAGRAH
jgi:hypothetical protein